MIKQLQIQNFQSHKNTELEFDPGVNIIVGASDSGKTAIIRALRWLIWNRPTGDDFRSNWGGSTSVEVNIDKQKIIRIKDQAGNDYFLDGTKFSAFKTEVPEEIIKTLNINEINLQRQHDAPFLFSETSGSVAEFFNRIAGLNKIDIGLQNVNKWIREIDQSIKYKGEDLEKLQEEIKQFDYLDKFEVEVEVLEEMEKNRVFLAQSVGKLASSINHIYNLKVALEKNGKILILKPYIDQLDTYIQERNKLGTNRDKLAKTIEKLESLNRNLRSQQDLTRAESTVSKLSALYKIKTDITNYLHKSGAVLTHYVDLETKLKTYENIVHTLQEEFAKKMPNICPLCNQPIKNENHLQISTRKR